MPRAAQGEGEGGKVSKQYIEDVATGDFYALNSKKRRFLNFFRCAVRV